MGAFHSAKSFETGAIGKEISWESFHTNQTVMFTKC